jgi:ribosomal-protein-alanine N-acetyltransferase
MLNKDFAQKVLDYYNINKEFFEPWLPAYEDGFFTHDYQRERLISEYNETQKGSMVKYWMFKKEDRNFDRIIGDITYSVIIRGVFQSCFTGYKVDKNENGKGYATECIKKCNEVVFNDLKLHRIEANIIPRNIASIKVVEKCGFRYEGVSEKYLKINNKWEDHAHYVLLNPSVE